MRAPAKGKRPHKKPLNKLEAHEIAEIDKLIDDAGRGANATLSIDLAAQEIRGPDGGAIRFEIDPFRKRCLLEGLDDIGLTMEKKTSIDSYEAKAKTARAWA